LNRKKISLYSLTTSYVESSISENSHFIHVLNSQLVNLGMKVKTITPHSMGLPKKETRNGVIINRFRYLPEKKQINSLTLPEAIKSKFGIFKVTLMVIGLFFISLKESLKEKPDIYHGHWAFPSGYIAFLFSKIFRKKSVITIHGSDIPLLKKFKFINKFVIPSLNKSSLVIANSNYTREQMINLGVKPEKIIKIPVPASFVKHEQSAEELGKFRRKFSDDSSKIVLFVGRLVEVKGVEYLIKSLREIKNGKMHLIIVGNGVLMEQLKNLSHSLNLENKVSFFGSANKKELGLLHGISDVFVCPSIIDSQGATEGLGLVIPEAMESRLPIIASSVGGITDFVKNEVNGLLVEQKNPSAIAKAIEKIFSDEELEKKMIENSEETVKEFSPKIIAQSYYDIFQSLLNN